MISDKNSINKHNPFVGVPPGSRRAPHATEVIETGESSGYGVPAPEESPLCAVGAGASDLRIGSPCDAPELVVEGRPLAPHLNIDEEILDVGETAGSEKTRTASANARRFDISAAKTTLGSPHVIAALVAIVLAMYIFRRR